MNDELKQLIQENAKAFAAIKVKGPTQWTDENVSKKVGYIAGAEAMAAEMEEFDDWLWRTDAKRLDSSNIREISAGKIYKDWEGNFYTFPDILTIYLQSKIPPPPKNMNNT